MTKVTGIFKSMDKFLGPDFEKGLARLKTRKSRKRGLVLCCLRSSEASGPRPDSMTEAVARMKSAPEPQTTAGICPHPHLSDPSIHRSATPRFSLRRLKGDRVHVPATTDSLTADLAGPHAPTALTGRAYGRRPTYTTTSFITGCPQLLDLAAEHLASAGHHAEANAQGDLISPRHSLAGQIRLIAGGVSAVCDDDPITPRPFGVQDHLDAALKVLESIPSGLGPPAIGVWTWRVADLRSLVTAWADEP